MRPLDRVAVRTRILRAAAGPGRSTVRAALVSLLAAAGGCAGLTDAAELSLVFLAVTVVETDGSGAAQSGARGVLTITSEPRGLACDTRGSRGRCSFGFLPGTAVRLTAELADGWVPVEWTLGFGDAPERVCGPSTTCSLPPLRDRGAGVFIVFTVRPETTAPPEPPPPPAPSTITWTGAAGTTDWLTASNWDLGRVPGATDSVVIVRAGATVDLGDPDDLGNSPGTVEIRALDHAGGTLRIRGPSNCANCLRLVIRGTIRSVGTGTRLVAERSEIQYRTSAEFATLETGPPGDNAVYFGDPTQIERPRATILRATGFLSFVFSDVRITEAGELVAGFGFGDKSKLTIGPTATVTADLHTGSGQIGGGLADTLVVEGTLRAPGDGFDFGHVTIERGGVLECSFARFRGGLRNHGTLRGLTVAPMFAASPVVLAGTVAAEAGSLIDVESAEFRVPTQIAGALRARTVQAAQDSVSSFSVTDASLGHVGLLILGRGPATIGWSAPASIDFLRAQVPFTVAAPPIELIAADTAVPLSLTSLELSGRGLVGRGLTASPRRARLAPGRLVVGGTGMSLDNVTLDVGGPGESTITGSGLGAAVRGSNAARVIQRGPTRLVTGASLGPAAPATPARSFYFEHRGVVIPASGTSFISGCIITEGGTVGPGSGTVTFQPLATGDC